VVVEATKDGINWEPIEDGYDANSDADWLSAYDANTEGTTSLYVDHAIDLTNNFATGDTLLFRFRMFSNAQNVGWGWSIDNIYIQADPLGVEVSANLGKLSIYPVPSKGGFTMDYQLVSKSNVSVAITSITGKQVKAYNLGTKPAGIFRFKLEDYVLDNGTYIVSVSSNGGIKSQQIFVSK
jgi:hypothetical protein